MLLRNWQILAASIWATLAVLLLCRSLLFEADALARLPIRNWTIAILLCGFFAVWNLARWMQMRSAAVERAELNRRLALRPSPEAKPGYEYNPEFDFQRHEKTERPEDRNP